MTELDKLMSNYEKSDVSDKYQIVLEVEFIEDYKKWNFFLEVLKSSNEEQILIEVLKIVKCHSVPSNLFQQYKNEILSLIDKDDDWVLKSFCIMALEFCKNDNDVIEKSKSILFDSKEFINTRFNAFYLIEDHFIESEKQKIKKELEKEI